MDFEVDGDGLFRHNDSYEYDGSYEYKDEAEARAAPALLLPLLYSALLLVGLLGNGLVLAALLPKRRSWSMSDTFVLHLCVADVLLLLTLPLWTAQALRLWQLGLAACKISTVLFYVSLHLIFSVTWERGNAPGFVPCNPLADWGRSTHTVDCNISGKRRK